MDNKKRLAWDTSDEVDFLRGLGVSGVGATTGLDRLDLLKSYRKAMERRTHLIDIDRKRVLAFVDREIAAEEALA